MPQVHVDKQVALNDCPVSRCALFDEAPLHEGRKTHARQVALRQQRGMIIEDEATARFSLQHLTYYRLALPGARWVGARFGETLQCILFGYKYAFENIRMRALMPPAARPEVCAPAVGRF